MLKVYNIDTMSQYSKYPAPIMTMLLSVTTEQKNALQATTGMIVFDTTLMQLSYYDGQMWIEV
jgi:hypothetical protein